MNSIVHHNGYNMLARLLAGEDVRPNCMFVEFDNAAGPRDSGYFDRLKSSGRGYAVVPVAETRVDGCKVTYRAVVGVEDLPFQVDQPVRMTCATLVHVDPVKGNLFLSTSDLKEGTALVPGVNSVVTVGINFGA